MIINHAICNDETNFQETLNLMKAEGWKFPAVREAEAMFEADTAPEWAEGDVCNRCRVAFGMMTRQHHCRACGQVFCHKCSSKSCNLPKQNFRFEKSLFIFSSKKPCKQYGLEFWNIRRIVKCLINTLPIPRQVLAFNTCC